MRSEIYVFLSLFLVSVILHIVFAILKKDIIYKISFSLHLPLLGIAQYFYLSNFYPDSEYLVFLFILVYGFLSVASVLYCVLSEQLIVFPSLFFIGGTVVLYLIYKPVYYFYSISTPVVILALIFTAALSIFAVVFGKIRNFRKILSFLVLNVFSLSIVCVTFFNLIYEKKLWCIFAFIGAVFIAAFTVLKTLCIGKRLNFSQKFINPAFPVAAILFSLSTVFMYKLF